MSENGIQKARSRVRLSQPVRQPGRVSCNQSKLRKLRGHSSLLIKCYRRPVPEIFRPLHRIRFSACHQPTLASRKIAPGRVSSMPLAAFERAARSRFMGHRRLPIDSVPHSSAGKFAGHHAGQHLHGVKWQRPEPNLISHKPGFSSHLSCDGQGPLLPCLLEAGNGTE